MVIVAMKEKAKAKIPTKIIMTPKKTPGQNCPGAMRLHNSQRFTLLKVRHDDTRCGKKVNPRLAGRGLFDDEKKQDKSTI